MENTALVLMLLLVATVALTVLCVWILAKVSRTEDKLVVMRAELRRSAAWEFRQVEDLYALYSRLRPRHPLPNTRGWAASPDFLRIVMDEVLEKSPKKILELGSGTSTVTIGYALEKLGSGNLWSLDHDAAYLSTTRHIIDLHGLQDRVFSVHAPLVSIAGYDTKWYDLTDFAETGIDMLVIDGPPAGDAPNARCPALPILFERLSPGAVVILDDADREGEKQCVEAWIKRFPELRVEHRACEKGCVVLRG
ncbi:MAG: class I SAM-dependent methyltransferase [Spiribacter salinus]|uniref:Class I SAM-dependent methyltransferase n=1 Tax=Spiribacter salinus TaxID=1335746 RepID=A0A540VTP1_9GAMM|nr:MAG: class I SAM-dependent methyltransferase [Spiribacter salinus]